MPTLTQVGSRISEATPAMIAVKYGGDPLDPTSAPWLGSMRSRPRDQVPRNFLAGGTDFLYLPRSLSWKRRAGQTQKFDTFGAAAGLAPFKSSMKARHAEEFLSGSLCSDGIQSLISLYSRETVLSGVDDGRFACIWVRDQVGNSNYTLGSEFNATEYPAPGNVQRYKVAPLWYDSGEGGLTRGTTEFARRFFGNGSRRFANVGGRWLFPSLNATPFEWNGEKATATGSKSNRVKPLGPWPPVHGGTCATGTAVADGPWLATQRFAWAVAFRLKDGSVTDFCKPRHPNATLTNGLRIHTVGTSADWTLKYRSITFSNLPARPDGAIGLLIYRTPSVDASSGQMPNLTDLRLRWEIQDLNTTTFEDTWGDDASLRPDDVKLFIRNDFIGAPRSRYAAAGDMRYVHAYGGQNPVAIVLAPVGRSADYDLNSVDTTEALYNYPASYFRIQYDMDLGSYTFDLIREDSGADPVNVTKSFNLSTFNTLQKLVDGINATNFAGDSLQWRAEIAPGASPDSTLLPGTWYHSALLTPTARLVGTCYSTGGTAIIKQGAAAGGIDLRMVPVGAVINSGFFPANTYVLRIEDDGVGGYQLVMSANNTGAVVNQKLTFVADLGDNPTANTTQSGYQRVICGALPAYAYFARQALNAYTGESKVSTSSPPTSLPLDASGIDKQCVWMTSAAPGAARTAPEQFSAKPSNVHHAASPSPGIVMGIAPVDNGFVVPYSGCIAAIRNTSGDQAAGIDEYYSMQIMNPVRGCCAWATVGAANRVAHYMTPEGITFADLFDEFDSALAIYVHGRDTLGDFTYELPLCEAATAQDNDSAYAHARIVRGELRVNYRASGSHPNRQVRYDFSTNPITSGLAAVRRPDGSPWGWSLPLRQSLTVMVQARRLDGSHVYGFNDENGGSTGDGRVDEFDVTDRDNGVDIAATASGPWERLGRMLPLSAQEVALEHICPAASTGDFNVYRSYAAEQFPLTVTDSDAQELIRDLLPLKLAARVLADAYYWEYTQATGRARELRKVALNVKPLQVAAPSGFAGEVGYVDIAGDLLPTS